MHLQTMEQEYIQIASRTAFTNNYKAQKHHY